MKKYVGIIIFVFLVILAVNVAFMGLEKENFDTDAEQFKYEYERLNGKKAPLGKKYRSVSISENNPIIYASLDDIVEFINEKQTFAVYFGFSDCPWCRSCIEIILKCAEQNEITKLYYVDILEERDMFEIDGDEVKKISDASASYYELLDMLGEVLSDYILVNDNDEEIYVGEKRIYAPNTILVADGRPIMIAGTSKLQKDANEELTVEIISDYYNIYSELFSKMSDYTAP